MFNKSNRNYCLMIIIENSYDTDPGRIVSGNKSIPWWYTALTKVPEWQIRILLYKILGESFHTKKALIFHTWSYNNHRQIHLKSFQWYARVCINFESIDWCLRVFINSASVCDFRVDFPLYYFYFCNENVFHINKDIIWLRYGYNGSILNIFNISFIYLFIIYKS